MTWPDFAGSAFFRRRLPSSERANQEQTLRAQLHETMEAIRRDLELLQNSPDLDGPIAELSDVLRQIEESLSALDGDR